jgi:hypothetical protein
LGWRRAKALAPDLIAEPAHAGDRQGRKLRRPVWLPKRSAELVLLVCPSRGAVRLKRSSGRRLLRSGSFRHPSSWCKLSGKGHAAVGVRRNHGGERPLTRRSTGRQKRGAFGSLRYRSGAGYLSVNGQAPVSFGLASCKGLGTGFDCRARSCW